MQNSPKKPAALISMTEFEEKEMPWLWYPYIPARDATMIFGPGGYGKSHIAMDIAARVSTGEPFPFSGATKRPAEKVLILSAEDDPSYVLKPRLRKAGANMANIFVPPGFFTVDRKGLELIDYYIEAVTLGLVFIDPVVAYIGSKVDLNRANEVREFVGGLQGIAQAHGIPIVYVHHARKGSEGRDGDRAMGSADFVNGSRSTLFVTKAPNGDKIMMHTKSNYAPEGAALSFAYGENGFEWTGKYDADGTRTAGGAKRNSASDWIKEVLKTGPQKAAMIEEEAARKGINHRTLTRAKQGIAESYLIFVNGKKQWYWKLKETANGEADLPIMDAKWGTEGSGIGRTEREIIAREADRARKPVGSVVSGGPEASVDDLMDKVLG